ncbi:MAG: hypothetical protein IJD22_03985 [Clostridia bacterium]|nr:hypothetical protein [Clostridia bacterium]
MKKKLVCILLCAVMLFSGLMSTGCSLTTGDATSSDTSGTSSTDSARTSMTLSLWVPVEEGTTEEALYLVESAINVVTQKEFDTAIKLYGIPEDEYDDLMKERIAFIDKRVIEEEEAAKKKRQEQIAAAQKGETIVEETTEYVNPNMDGDYSLVVRGAVGYTPVERNQLDIFLVRGMDDYNYYADSLYVENLSEELNGSSKVLKNYIYTDFFTAVTRNDGIFAIPNNHAVGEYTYFLVNKRIAESEYLDATKLISLSACNEEGFIDAIAQYYEGVTPVYGNYMPNYYQFWNGDGDINKFSVITSRVMSDTTIETVKFENVFANPNFTTNYGLYKSFKDKGYVSTSETVPDEFGVGYITCTADEIKEYADDYEIHVFEQPLGYASDYTQGMFAVSSFTKSLPRSMEIITLLNTSTELRTILQYGVEGTHWKYDEEDSDIIVKLDTIVSDTDITYNMNLFDTGNVYMTYPTYGETLDEWQTSKDQNLDSYLPATYYFMANKNLEGDGPIYVNEFNKDKFETLDKYSAEMFARIEAMTAEEFTSSIETLKNEVNKLAVFDQLVYTPTETDSSKGKTPDQGWEPEGSLTYIWQQYLKVVLGDDSSEG